MIDYFSWKRPLRSPSLTLTQHYQVFHSTTSLSATSALPFYLPSISLLYMIRFGWTTSYSNHYNLHLRFTFNGKIKNKILL